MQYSNPTTGSLEDLETSTPLILVAADSTSIYDDEKLACWVGHNKILLNCSFIVKKSVLLQQPSSASPVKAFSLMNNSFNS